MPTAGYEFFDHTADLGVRVHAASRADLVPPATAGLYAAIGELVGKIEVEQRVLEFRDADPAHLLRDYLAKLISIFEIQDCLAYKISVQEFTDDALVVAVRLVELDPANSVFAREVKAVTYHDLLLEQEGDQYRAEFILDI